MEKLTTIAPYITIANSAGIVGLFLYQQKQNQQIALALETLGKNLTNMSNKLGSVVNSDEDSRALMKQFNDDVIKINKNIKRIISDSDMEDIKSDIEDIVDALNENGTKIKLSSKKKSVKKNKKKSKYDSDSSDSDSEDERPRKKREKSRDRGGRHRSEVGDDVVEEFKKSGRS